MQKFIPVAQDRSLAISDCLVVAISTHGETQTVKCGSQKGLSGYNMYEEIDRLWGRDGPVEVKRILQPFNETSCLELKDKPKIFFLQV